MTEKELLKEKFDEVTSLEDIKYFYHVTNMNPNTICQQGLFLVENQLSSTTIEIPQEFKDDPAEYCTQERGNNYRKEPCIIILGIPEENVKYAVVKNYEEPMEWNLEEFPKYVIPSEYIIGYINAMDFSFTLNENYAYANEFYL